MKRVERDQGKPIGMPVDDLRQFMGDRSRYRIEPRREAVTGFSFSHVDWIVRILWDMKWKFLVAPPGGIFITSDSPAHWEDPTPRPPIYAGHGLAMEHVEVTCPISPRLCLLAGWNYRSGLYVAQSRQVREINNRTIGWSLAEFYSPRPFKLVPLPNHQSAPIFGI